MKSGNFFIQYYKQFINPAVGGKCKHIPSCSAYMGQAIAKKGYIKGSAMGVARILRCNPFSKGGYDPVKDNLKGKAKWLL